MAPLLVVPGRRAAASPGGVSETLREADVLAAGRGATGSGSSGSGKHALKLPSAAGPLVLRRGPHLEVLPLVDADAHAPLPAQPSVDALRAAFSLQEGATFALQEDELGPVANAAAAVRAEKKRLKKERKAAKKIKRAEKDRTTATAGAHTSAVEASLNSSDPTVAAARGTKRGRTQEEEADSKRQRL